MQFLASSAFEVLYGGAKGPGESKCLVMAASRYALDPKILKLPAHVNPWDPSKSKSLILPRSGLTSLTPAGGSTHVARTMNLRTDFYDLPLGLRLEFLRA